MSKLLSRIKNVVVEAKDFHMSSPSSVFKAFIATVLIQFSFLSLTKLDVGTSEEVLPLLKCTFASVRYWWGILGLFGAASLLFEKYIKGNLVTLVFGYTSAIASLVLLSYDFITTEPPIHTGGILAATAVVFLGGLLYGRVKDR